MKIKQIGVLLLLGFCCISALPLIILLLEACNSGYDYSILAKLVAEME